MYDWIIRHKEDLGWLGAALLGFWRGWKFVSKKLTPFIKQFKRVAVVSGRVDKIEKELDIVTKRQFALIYVDTRPIFILNKKGEVIHVNAAWLEMTEMQNERDALGFGYMQAIPDADKEMMMDRSEMFLEHPGSFSGEVRFQKIRSKQIITTYCRSEVIKNNETLYETIGILSIKNQQQ